MGFSFLLSDCFKSESYLYDEMRKAFKLIKGRFYKNESVKKKTIAKLSSDISKQKVVHACAASDASQKTLVVGDAEEEMATQADSDSSEQKTVDAIFDDYDDSV